MRTLPVIVVAIWCGALLGLLEGVVLTFSRLFPEVRSPHKVSADALWIAPLVNICAFLLAGVALSVLARLLDRWKSLPLLPAGYALFIAVGLSAAIFSSGWIHWSAAGILGVGAAVAFLRTARGREASLTQRLSRLVWIAPVLLIAAWIAVNAHARLRESSDLAALPAATPDAPNVLVIVMDTVRADSFQRQGQPSLTPNLDRFVARGTNYTRAWSTSSWSLPTQASILTGRHPHEHGADWPGIRMKPHLTTMAEYFAARGYATGAFSSNAAWVTPEHLGRGFLRFETYRVEDVVRRTTIGRVLDALLSRVNCHAAGRGKPAPVLNAQFIRFLDDFPDRPYFAYLCFMDVNRTFHARRFNSGFGVRPTPAEEYEAYERGLTELDVYLGKLLDDLRARGELDNTVVFVTSDHGQSFGPTVACDHSPSGHGSSLYPEQTRIPMFLVYPPKVAAGEHVNLSVSLRDVGATTVSLIGAAHSPFGGRPFPRRPNVASTTSEAPDTLLMTLNYDPRELRSVVAGDLLYITDQRKPAGVDREELYDLSAGPQTKRLPTTHERLPALRQSLARELSTTPDTAAEMSPASEGYANNTKSRIR